MPRHAIALLLAAILTLAASSSCSVANMTIDGITADVMQVYDTAQDARVVAEHTIDSSFIGNFTVGQFLVGLVILIVVVLAVMFITSNFLLIIVVLILLAVFFVVVNYAGVI